MDIQDTTVANAIRRLKRNEGQVRGVQLMLSARQRHRLC